MWDDHLSIHRGGVWKIDDGSWCGVCSLMVFILTRYGFDQFVSTFKLKTLIIQEASDLKRCEVNLIELAFGEIGDGWWCGVYQLKEFILIRWPLCINLQNDIFEYPNLSRDNSFKEMWDVHLLIHQSLYAHKVCFLTNLYQPSNTHRWQYKVSKSFARAIWLKPKWAEGCRYINA